MTFKRRVFVSVPVDDHLDTRQINLKNKILEKVIALGYEPQIFLFSGMPAGMAWSFSSVNEVMRKCHGALILGFPRWSFQTQEGVFRLPTEYNHYEGALANSRSLPILTIAEQGIVDRGIHWTGGGNPILFMPADANDAWLLSPSFQHRFNVWADQMSERRDLFFGYCGQAKETAQSIYIYLTNKLKLTVMDWGIDFTGGGTILEEIERAAKLCTVGLFLFTKDDELLKGETSQAAPRDNVIFEAGYFVNSKGKDRVLIIREEGAKMPADLGGNIYIHLVERKNTAAIETALREFFDRRL